MKDAWAWIPSMLTVSDIVLSVHSQIPFSLTKAHKIIHSEYMRS